MKKIYCILSIYITNIYICYSQNSTISGIVNFYTPVVSIDTCPPKLTVSNAANFNIGDTVLIIQMQGAVLNQTNTSGFGDIIDTNHAGNYEINYISNILGNQVFLNNNISRKYDVNGKVQLIKIPQYVNATIGGTLTCQSWNGTTGGVLILQVQNDLTFNANIDTQGKGFRGGDLVPDDTQPFVWCDLEYFYNTNTNSGGKKGEGIAEYITNKILGRGKQTNGAGGGNDHNAGGGGGGNAGSGGMGGGSVSNGCINGGIGGSNLNYSNTINKIFMGGGGGGGHQNNTASTPGTNGGAIVILIAGNSIIGNNFSILSNGLDQNLIALPDGAGGGGAGGTLLIDCPVVNNLAINLKGGKGGDNNWHAVCVAPGGGGGGGIFWHNSTLNNVNFDLSGGIAGIITHPSSSCFNSNYNAANGMQGLVLNGLSLVYSSNNFSNNSLITSSLGNTICLGDTTQLFLNIVANSYSWSPSNSLSNSNIQNPFAFPTNTTTYTVVYTTNNGCILLDSIKITVQLPPQVQLGNDTFMCSQSQVFTIANIYHDISYNYIWNNGSNNSFIVINTSGQYWVQVSNSCGVSSDTISILDSTITLIIPADTSICLGDTLFITPFFNNASIFNWSNGLSVPSINIFQPGTYILTASNSFCKVSKSVTVTVIDTFNLETMFKDTTICLGSTFYFVYDTLIHDFSINNIDFYDGIAIVDSGFYTIKYKNFCASSSKNIYIRTKECDCDEGFYIPNAFTPDRDNLNESFKPILRCIPEQYDFMIFDRWGELIFHTNFYTEGWDGYYNSRLCPLGVYVWKIFIRYEINSSAFHKLGSVTLIR